MSWELTDRVLFTLTQGCTTHAPVSSLTSALGQLIKTCKGMIHDPVSYSSC